MIIMNNNIMFIALAGIISISHRCYAMDQVCEEKFFVRHFPKNSCTTLFVDLDQKHRIIEADKLKELLVHELKINPADNDITLTYDYAECRGAIGLDKLT